MPPTSLQGNPLAFLRGAGGSVAPPGPTVAAPGPGSPMEQMASMDGGGPDGGAGGDMPPELQQLLMAQQIMPALMAQQKAEYYKKFLKQFASILREFMRIRGIGPKTSGRIGAAVTNLGAAVNDMDKEKPEDSDPIQSLLAQGMQSKPAMGGTPPMQTQLPVTRF